MIQSCENGMLDIPGVQLQLDLLVHRQVQHRQTLPRAGFPGLVALPPRVLVHVLVHVIKVPGPLLPADIDHDIRVLEAGINGLLNLTALLGISLFMINLLPLPALDGGRLLFIFIELLRGGRRIAPEKEGLVHFAGMVVLLALMAIITIFDVGRLFQGASILPGR